ncbi:hypothetical protein B0H12DRAFT_964233, partial [Mycena haematopus]
THTYLDGTGPGLWAVGTLHSTATLSNKYRVVCASVHGMHRPNIFLSHHGHS